MQHHIQSRSTLSRMHSAQTHRWCESGRQQLRRPDTIRENSVSTLQKGLFDAFTATASQTAHRRKAFLVRWMRHSIRSKVQLSCAYASKAFKWRTDNDDNYKNVSINGNDKSQPNGWKAMQVSCLLLTLVMLFFVCVITWLRSGAIESVITCTRVAWKRLYPGQVLFYIIYALHHIFECKCHIRTLWSAIQFRVHANMHRDVRTCRCFM